MNLTLKIWRQKNAKENGEMVDYQIADVSPDMSFLEMLDVLNDALIEKGLMVTFVVINLCFFIKVFCENKTTPRNEFVRDGTNAFVIHPR